MPQKIVDYKSPTTGKSYSFDWNKDTDPTDEDYANLKAWVDDQESSKKVDENATFKPYTGGLPEINEPKNFFTQAYQRVASGVNNYVDQALGPMAKSYDPNAAMAQGNAALKTPIRSSINTFVPIDQTIQDIKEGNYGGASANVGMTALGVKALRDFSASKPINKVIPDVTVPDTVAPPPQIRGLLPAIGETAQKPRFIGTPTGKIGDALNLDTPEAIQAESLKAPETPVPNEMRPERTAIFPKPTLDLPYQPRTNLDVQSPSTPRSMGINLETTQPKGTIFDTVPPRMMGSPIEAGMRDTALGGRNAVTGRGIKPTIEQGGLGNWGGEPETVNIGRGLSNKAKTKLPNLTLPDEGMLPSAPVKGPISRFKPTLPDIEVPKAEPQVASKVPDVTTQTPLNEVPIKSYAPNFRKFVGSNPVFKSIMDKWINTRAQSPFVGAKAVDNFGAQLKDLKPEDLPALQQELSANPQHPIRQMLDSIYNKMKSAGIDVDYKKNYLPQMWKERLPEIQQALGDKRLSTNAPFTYESVFKDYQTGIKAGLTPKFAPMDLLKWYAERSNRLIADHTAFQEMKAQGYIEPATLGNAKNWPSLDPNLAPSAFKSASGEQIGTNWRVDPRVKKVVENYLENPEGIVAGAAKVSGRATSMTLAGGVPKFPLLQAHGLNTLRNAWREGGLKRVGQAVKAGLPKLEETNTKYWKDNRDTLIKAAGDGLEISNPDTNYKPAYENASNPITKSLNWLDKKNYDYFRKPLFEEFIPKVMLEAYKDRVSQGIDGKTAASDINTSYGHLNNDLLYKSKEFQNAAKTLFLAPNWLESRFRQLVLTNPTYLKAAGRSLASYAAMNAVNMMSSGKPMWANATGHESDIYAGKDDKGSERYVDYAGTAEDMLKLPFEVAMSIIKKQSGEKIMSTLYNKSGVYEKLLADFYKGEDRGGNTNIFTSKNQFGKPVPLGTRTLNTLGDISQVAAPSAVKGMTGLFGGQGIERSLVESAQAPIQYTYPKKVKGPSFMGPPRR